MAISFRLKILSNYVSVYCKCKNSLTVPSLTGLRLKMKHSTNSYSQPKPTVFSNRTKIDQVTHVSDSISSADFSIIKDNESGTLEPCDEDVSDITPFVSPTYNLAAYANQSHTLQQFIKMGVNLHKVEQRKGSAECILKLDFDTHVKMHLRFLHDIGIPAEDFGVFITKNPFIFEQSLEDLEVRINYLQAKRFSTEDITRIVTVNPLWLNFSSLEIDKRLGFFQRYFVLSGDEVRLLAAKRPKLITEDLTSVLRSLFAVKEDMGFSESEAKSLLLSKPKLYSIATKELKERFDFVHNIMGISHEQLCQQPNVLTFRKFLVQQRHEFLKSLGKAQYNPKHPGYNSLDALVYGDDVVFCTNVAKTSVSMFNDFLKTL